jgi:formylglycine-generating enzyme required for sulfatase activity
MRSAKPRHACTSLLAAAAAAAVIGCAEQAPPRPQLVVEVDLDVPLPVQLAGQDELAGDSAVDTLRVDAFRGDGWSQPFDLRDFIAPAPDDWPLSFGVVPGEVSFDEPIHLRLRAFRGRLGSPGTLDGAATIDPPTDLSIDRLVSVMPPAEGVRRVRVMLRGDCLGVFNTFDSDPAKVRTCVDDARKQAAPEEDVAETEEGEKAPTQAGTWAGALPVPCSGPSPAGVDAVCVPGGFSVLGALAFEGTGDGIYDEEPTPLRPVRLSPFFLDRTEVTVGALRELLADPAKDLSGVTPLFQDDAMEDGQYCTWLGPDDPANDALPLNCLKRSDAAAICEARGGSLPSEAQWEHAARGRGRGSLYPWGDLEPTGAADCCLLSAAREPSVNSAAALCPGEGVEPAGSHPATPACKGLGDQSRDGVLDLAGSLTELVADSFLPYSASCWLRGTGALLDPLCIEPTEIDQVCRGGNWNGGQSASAAPFRHSFNAQRPTSGFRCAYKDGAP